MMRQDNATGKYLILIMIIAIICNIAIIASPAFYNHDELQKIDFLQEFGFSKYVEIFFKIFKTEKFEIPVRPVGYIIWAVTLLSMPDYPFLVHLFDVIIHGIVACSLYILLKKVTGFQRHSFISAIFFAMSPLATLAVGWSGAIFDRLYILFSLLTAYFFIMYIKHMNNLYLIPMIIMSIFAILSKETAMMLPAFVILIIISYRIHDKPIDIRMAVKGIIFCSLPILIYLFLRIIPLLNSLLSYQEKGSSTYSISLMQMPINALIYFLYPFFIPLTETINYVFYPLYFFIISGMLHLIIIILIYAKWGFRTVFLYITYYFIFLVPVLFIKNSNSHYLYGSGLILSIAMAFLLIEFKYWMLRYIILILFVILSVHTIVVQKSIYNIGLCQAKLLYSMDSISKSFDELALKKGIKIVTMPGSPDYIVRRTFFGRNRIGNISGVNFEVVNDYKNHSRKKDEVLLFFNDSCNIFIEYDEFNKHK